MRKSKRKSYVIHLDVTYNAKQGSESSLETRSEDGEVTSPCVEQDPRTHEDDDAENSVANQIEEINNQQLTDADGRSQSPQQRYIVETITMTTVTERRIVREADDDLKNSQQKKPDGVNQDNSKLSGILKGGKLWKSDPVNPEHEEVTSFGSPGSPEEVDGKRFVRFNRDSDGTQSQDDEEGDEPEDDDGNTSGEQDTDNLEAASPDTTELTLTFKLGNHVLVANSLKPNSAVRQLFPAQRLISPNQKYLHESGDTDQEDGDGVKGTPQPYLITAESLKLFEESKRAKVSNFFNNQDSILSNSVNTDDVPVNTNLIKRTIERNTLRRSLLRYEPGRNKRCMKRHDDNSLVERIKQLTCDVEDDVQAHDYGEILERSSPTGEESKPLKQMTDNTLKPNSVSSNEIGSNGIRYNDKSLSPSSSSSSGSTTSTYKKLTDLFGRRNDKLPHDHVDHMNMQQEFVVNSDYNNSVYLSPPDLGNGLPLTPPKDFGVDRSGAQQTFVSPKQAVAKTVTSEARKQFLSTLAPLTACVGAGNGGSAEDGDYYHVSPGMHPLTVRVGDRLSVASTNTESEYSLNDIEEVLEDESSQPQPDLVAGTQTDSRPQVPGKSSTVKGVIGSSKSSGASGNSSKSEVQGSNSKAPGNKGNAVKCVSKGTGVQGGSLRVSNGKQKGAQPQGSGSKVPPSAQNQDPTDELALFVQQDASRTERIKKRYSLNSPPNTSDDENDDYGFNKRPSVRGIKPRFGSTTEILQQMQSQMQPPTLACNSRVTWPYPNEPHPRKGMPVRSPQMPCVQEENVVYYQGNYNGNHICANQNFTGHQVCVQNHTNIGCGHQAVGCVQNQVQSENHVKDGMGRKYVSNSTIYASTGNLYENQNQIMRIGDGCSEGQLYGTLGVRYLHHQTHLQHPGTSSSPPPPGVHRDFQNYNVANVVHSHEGLPPCMNQDPRFSADMQNCHHHNKERRFSGDVLPLSQNELRFSGENMPNQTPPNQKELRYSSEGLPTTAAVKDPRYQNESVPNCHHQERYTETPVANQKDPRYFYGDMNSNQRYAGVGEGVPTQFQDVPCNVHYQDPRSSGVQTLDRNFTARRCNPNAVQMRISPTSNTQTQQYQTTLSSTSVRMSAPYPDPNITAIIDPHYSTYRPPNPAIRVGVGQQQTIRVPYSGAPVQVHLMARGVRSDSPQRCSSPLGTPPGMNYPQCVIARGTQTVHQTYQGGRGYYARVAGENSGTGGNPAIVAGMLFEMGYQDLSGGMQNSLASAYADSGRNVCSEQPSASSIIDSFKNEAPPSQDTHHTEQGNVSDGHVGGSPSEKSPSFEGSDSRPQHVNGAYDNHTGIPPKQMLYVRQINAPMVYQTQHMSPTKQQNTERGVPEGAASVPTSFPQDSTYSNSTNTATSPMETTNQVEQTTLTSSPGVYYAMNV